MATITFLWHLHQPCYRTADNVAHAPWAIVHAGGSYATLAGAITETGARGQVVNLVPTLVEQVEAYHGGRVHDPLVRALTHRAAELSGDERERLLDWGFHVPGRQLERYPRLRELAARRGSGDDPARLAARFGTADLRDLQVLFILAQAGEQAWRDERLEELHGTRRGFGEDDHARAAAWLEAQPGELLERWQRLDAQDGVEIATSPYAHPIMPLLCDTGIVSESWAPEPAPPAPPFQHPEDARAQLAAGLGFMAERGFTVSGCWPPEGSVSAAAVQIYADAGVRWLVTDEGILARSLGRDLRPGGATIPELYRPWRPTTPSPMIFFRDRWLSDTIGFVYGHWEDEGRAAADLVRHLTVLAQRLPADAAVVIAMDGENAWLHYPDAGGRFLRELFGRLNDAGPDLEPATFAELSARLEPATLPRLHPGSWIGGTFATWIGHPEKSRGWEILGAVREAVAAAPNPRPESLLVAEASDWFWWLGDDNPTELAPLYDEIFRRHLGDVCRQAGIEPPVDLDQPLKSATLPVRVPVSRQWPAPVLDGAKTTYFEWSLAAWVEAESPQPLRRLALWSSGETLFLLVETEGAARELVDGGRLVVRLTASDGSEVVATATADGCEPPAVRCAIGRVAELAIPWDGRPGHRLEVRVGPHRLPEEAILLLEPTPVDEELTPSQPEE